MTLMPGNMSVLKADSSGRIRTPRAKQDEILRAFDESGASGVEFARMVGVKYPTFAAWIRRRKRSKGRLKQEHEVEDIAEDQRRKKRIEELQRVAANQGRAASILLLEISKATHRSPKFVRWFRHAVREQLTETTAVPRLSLLLASLLSQASDTNGGFQ